jgi:superfamily II RNA helicase
VSVVKEYREGWALAEIERAQDHLQHGDVVRALASLASVTTMLVEEAEVTIPGLEQLMLDLLGRVGEHRHRGRADEEVGDA